MAEGIIMRRGGGSDLALRVVMQYDEPANPTEDMIWIKERTPLKEWTMGPENPYIAYQDVILVGSHTTTAAGYLSTSGGISSQSSTEKEVYTEDYVNVAYGVEYEYRYALSASKSQWLAICEYKGDGTFIKRLTPVNSVTGAYIEGTYTPSSADVAMVRMAWRTYGDDACSVQLIRPDVEYTPESTEEGSVFIKTYEGLGVPVSVLKRNGLIVYPASVRVYAAPSLENMFGGWVDADAYVYKTDVIETGAFTPMRAEKPLYLYGDPCKNVTGGWVKTSGTLTVNEDSLNIKGSTGRMATTYMIDTTGFKALEFDVLNTSASKVASVGIGTSQTAFTVSAQAGAGMSSYTTITVDLADYQGMYYVQVYTTDSSVGCSVNAVRLVA